MIVYLTKANIYEMNASIAFSFQPKFFYTFNENKPVDLVYDDCIKAYQIKIYVRNKLCRVTTI